jgi:hypothetical protein
MPGRIIGEHNTEKDGPLAAPVLTDLVANPHHVRTDGLLDPSDGSLQLGRLCYLARTLLVRRELGVVERPGFMLQKFETCPRRGAKSVDSFFELENRPFAFNKQADCASGAG